jgi:surface antigen
MRIKSTLLATFVALSTATVPALVQALDLTFLDQAPIRFFDNTDLKMMSDAADQALDKAEVGEAVNWSNEQTGNSGNLTPTRSFSRDGKDCRRLEIVSLARKATRGSATSRVDFCNIDGTWRILTIAP